MFFIVIMVIIQIEIISFMLKFVIDVLPVFLSGGKVFQESITPGLTKPRKALGDVNTPASSRPRKALGDVNGTSGSILKPVKGKSGGLKPLSLNSQSFKKPEGKRSQVRTIGYYVRGIYSCTSPWGFQLRISPQQPL